MTQENKQIVLRFFIVNYATRYKVMRVVLHTFLNCFLSDESRLVSDRKELKGCIKA